MKTIEYRFADKSKWGEGEWQGEPDKVQWMDKETGLPCLIVRNDRVTGSLCGYVGVPEGHPVFEKPYQDLDIDCHGGLTFSSFCLKDTRTQHGICHVVEPGESDRVWWLGFDCAHGGDIMPMMVAKYPQLRMPSSFGGWEKYRNIGYVKDQCGNLAKQLSELNSRRS